MLAVLASMLLIVAIISLIVAARIVQKRKEKERTQALQLTAEELGWSFEPGARVDTIPGIDGFALFDLGHSKEIAFDKMFSVFGYQDIDSDQRPEFSRQYILRGHDEAAIRQTFNDRVFSFYQSDPGTYTDAVDNQLFVYRAGHRLQPGEIEPYIELGRQVLTLMEQY